MRLIDANELQKTFTEECCGCCDCCSHSMTGYKCELIDNAPTVEERQTTCSNCDSGYAQGYSDGYLQGKEERPTGEWINHYDDLFPEESTEECSICHQEQSIGNDDNYCPNCGAKMKGDSEE